MENLRFFLVYKIIDITPIGKKGYERIKDDFHKEQDKLVAYKEVLETKIKECDKTKSETIAILSGYSKEIDNLTDNLLKVCETSPNAKIKALGEQLKEQSDNLKVEIKEKYSDEKNELATTIESRKNDLETILKELQELKEKVYGEETKDN